MKLKLTARPYTMNGEYVQTELFNVKAQTIVEVGTLEEASKEAIAFASLHAPANVWVKCLDARKPRGFDKWNSGATQFLSKL